MVTMKPPPSSMSAPPPCTSSSASASASTATSSFPPPLRSRRLRVWFLWVCSCILLWTCLIQLLALQRLRIWPWQWRWHSTAQSLHLTPQPHFHHLILPSPPPLPSRIYKSNGFLKISCNGGLNQMRSAICDMVTVAYLLNLTLVVPELDKTSFWADTSKFADIFDVRHFIDSLRDEVHIIKRLPKRLGTKAPNESLVLAPISWSNEKYYLGQILPLFNKFNVIHFNKTDSRLSNNDLPIELQKLRCRVNYQALKFTPQIEALGNKLVDILQRDGSFVALHLRYEMDMLAFSGCTHGLSEEEAEELKRMRYAYRWWREKEINSESKRLQGLCPLTPDETSLVLQALGFEKNTRIFIASGEIYGGNRRLAALKEAFPQLLKKEMLIDPRDLWPFRNHSSQMAALDYMVSLASDIFIPTFDGNMAKVVEGHRRYLGFRKTIALDRKQLVELIDSYENKTLSWDQFVAAVQQTHESRIGQPACRRVVAAKPKEEDFFYANPYECLVNAAECHAPTLR